MLKPVFKRREEPRRRPALAPLELVMALPIVLTLAVGMVWLGFSVIGQGEVTVEARHQAWLRRFDNQASKPLIFTATPLYSRQADYVTARATRQIAVSPMFSGLPQPESTHAIMAGSWDYRALPLDRPPNWRDYVPAVANAKTAGFQTSLGNLENLASDLASSAADVLAEQINLGSLLDGLGGGFDNSASSADSQNREERRQEKAKLREEEQRLSRELAAVDAEINQLRADYVKKLGEDPPVDEEGKKRRQQELDRISQKIDLLKGKRERLSAELRDVESQLDALD